MSIEVLLTEIRDELRAIHSDLNAPVRPELITALTGLAHPQPPVAPSPPTGAPSTADAGLPAIVQEVLQASLPPPQSVFGQAALPSGAVAIPAAAPMVPPAPAATIPNQPLDIKGMPWDGRIHASSKAQVADGTWRMKRGVDPALVEQVTAQIKQTMAAPAVASGLASQPWPFPDPAATTNVGPVPINYAWLMHILPIKITSGELTTKMVTEACAIFGVPGLPDLMAREDLVPAVAKALGLAP